MNFKRVACIGKDSAENREFLAADKRIEMFRKLEATVVVGVASFDFILRMNGIETEYLPRMEDTRTHLCYRLSRLLNVDAVYVLPDKGRMTTIEMEMAYELKLPIGKMYPDP